MDDRQISEQSYIRDQNANDETHITAVSNQGSQITVDLDGDPSINVKAEHVSESEPEMVMIAGGENVSEASGSETESSSLRSEHIEEFQGLSNMENFAIQIASTLASVPEGCGPCKLRSLLWNDWNIDSNIVVANFGFDDLTQFLDTPFMRDYIEQKALINESIIYAVKVTPEIEHITQTIADEKLTTEQLAIKRKQQRLLEMRKPENQATFIEGKRRILGILLELRAFEEAVSFSSVQNEYIRKYDVCLNAKEQSRLFRNKSALKNIRNAFYKEVDVTNCNPLFVKLKTRNIELPTELSEEDKRWAVGIGDVEVPSFSEQSSEFSRQRTISQDDHSIASSTIATNKDTSIKRAAHCSREATMKWDEDGSSGSSVEDRQTGKTTVQTAKKEAIGNGVFTSAKTSSARDVRNTKWGGDSAKYTGDEESDESSGSEVNDSDKTKEKVAAAPHRSRRRFVEMDNRAPWKSSGEMLCVAAGGEDPNQALVRGLTSEGSRESGEHRRTTRSKSSRRQTTTERSLMKSIEKSEADWRRLQGASTPIPANMRDQKCYSRDTSSEMRDSMIVDVRAVDRRKQITYRRDGFWDNSDNERSPVRYSFEPFEISARNASSRMRPRLRDERVYEEDTNSHGITLSNGSAFLPVVKDPSLLMERPRFPQSAEYARHPDGTSERRFASGDRYSPEPAYAANAIRRQQSRHTFGHVSQPGSIHPSNIDNVSASRVTQQYAPERDSTSASRSSSSRQHNMHPSGHMSPMRPYPDNYFQRCGSDYPKSTDVQEPSPDIAHHFSSFSAPSSEFENRMNVATQTDLDWLEKALEQLELMGPLTNDSSDQRSGSTLRRVGGPDCDIIKLADVIEMIVERHSPRPVLMQDLPRLIESVYGSSIDPTKDRRYRMTWRQLVTDYCSARVQIYNIPEPEMEVLVCRSPNGQN